MNKHVRPLLFAALFISTAAYAQPTFYLTPSDTAHVNSGEETEIEIRTRDFTDLLEVRFSIRWDPAVAELVEISYSAPELAIAPEAFVIDNEEGFLTFAWHHYDMVDCYVSSASLPDSTIVFTASFLGLEGFTDVGLTDDPVPSFITRVNACPIDIACFCDQSIVLSVDGMLTAAPSLPEEDRSTRLFPNPAAGIIHLSLPEGFPLPTAIRILDPVGRECMQIDHPNAADLELSQLPSGMYFMELTWESDRKEVLRLLLHN